MGSIKLKPKAIKVVCNNCFRITTGYRDEDGIVKGNELSKYAKLVTVTYKNK